MAECNTLHVQLQNGSAHTVGTSYSGLYEEGEVEHINVFGPVLQTRQLSELENWAKHVDM